MIRPSNLFSLKLSINKVMVLEKRDSHADLFLNGNLLESEDRFSYLGSTVTSTLSLEEETKTGTGKAATTFGKLRERT